MDNVIKMRGITKIFPGTVANDNVDFDLRKGEVHVLLGENGAGKTTLMNILYGLYEPEKGEIYVNGEKVKIKNPSDAIKLGIGMVHQHFMLVNNFTVAQNIILGSEPTKGLAINEKEAKKKVQELADKYGFNVKPDDLIEDITVGQQQKVEILKALYRGAEILILDEPTAVLTPQEIEELAGIFKNLTQQGKSIILITHKLKEIMNMSDRVTIVRRGKLIDVVNTGDTNIDELAEMMVGRKVSLKVDKNEAEVGETFVKIENLKALDHRRIEILKGINLDIKKGEILGIAGVDGNGQSELIEILTGLRKSSSGKIMIGDKEITTLSSAEINKLNIGHVPEDRHKRGLVLKFSLVENSILGRQKDKEFRKGALLNYKAIRSHCNKLIKEFDVRTPNEDVFAGSLSGGNQQKLIVAREISKNPDFIIVAQPTRGLDVGAIEYIHRRLIEERDKGRAVLLVSSELDEVMNLSDRIAVIYDGKIMDILDAKNVTEMELGILMAGGSLNKEEKDV